MHPGALGASIADEIKSHTVLAAKFTSDQYVCITSCSLIPVIRKNSNQSRSSSLQVGWRSFQEPWLDTGNKMVTSIVLSVISAMAKQERQTLIDRTMSGLRTAKRNGKILGRPRRAIDWSLVNERVASGESVRSMARSLNVSHSLLLKVAQRL
jgi:hypothetical protein